MIAPESIDLTSLPSIALGNRATLPATSCVYFCLGEGGEVLYIGQSINLRQRWLSHHHRFHLKSMGKVNIAWLNVSDPALLAGIEAALIDFFSTSQSFEFIGLDT